MSPLFVRFSLYASIAVAVCACRAVPAQPVALVTTAMVESQVQPALPDAPSSVLLPAASPVFGVSSSLQQAPAPQQQAGAVPEGSAADQQTEAIVQKRVAECQKLPVDQQKACIAAAAEIQVKKEETQRNLFILPAFNTVIAGVSPPLTPGQKWDLVYHTAKDPYTFAIAFIVSGFGEAEDNSNYGWGPGGYFKDVGASYLDNVDGALIGNAVLPILLHQDPRYFRLGHGSLVRRILNAAGSTIICKGDNGKTEFNISNVAGNFIAGAISNTYYPAKNRGVGLAIDNAVVVTAEGAVGAQLLEFGPDLNAYLARRHARHLARKNGTPIPSTTSAPASPGTPPSQ